jgi:hypothetical protein
MEIIQSSNKIHTINIIPIVSEIIDNNCPICLDTLTDKFTLSCNHYYCKICISLHYNSNNPTSLICPLCRTTICRLDASEISNSNIVNTKKQIFIFTIVTLICVILITLTLLKIISKSMCSIIFILILYQSCVILYIFNRRLYQ